jgi:anti-sigma B factor antagonist
MEITKNNANGVLTLRLKGRLDTTTAPQLEQEVDAVNADATIRELHLDLKELAYTSSAGLRVMLKAQKLMNGRNGMKLHNVSEDIAEVFDITGFLDILTIE